MDQILIYVLAFLFSLSAVVFVHELGHYSIARLFGVRIETFSIGFGKELFGRNDKHGTRWVLSAIPLGGYIKIFGDVDPKNPQIWDHEKDEARLLNKEEREVAFCMKPVWQRSLIILAGPLANFLFTLLVLVALYATKGQVLTSPVVMAIGMDTSAYEAGFETFDKILAIDGVPITRFEEIWAHTRKKTDRPYVFSVLREGEIITISAASRSVEYNDTRGVPRSHGRLGLLGETGVKLRNIISVNGVDVKGDPEQARKELLRLMGRDIDLGVSFGTQDDVFRTHLINAVNEDLKEPGSRDYEMLILARSKDPFFVRHPPVDAVIYAVRKTGKTLDEGLKIIKVLLSGGVKRESLGGVATIGDMAGKAVEKGWYDFLIFMTILSVQIGFINLFPIPVLDGGYLLFLAYEAVMRKPLSQKLRDTLLILGLVFLLGIMIIANTSDLLRIIFK